MWWGKIIGAFFGFMLGGPFGAILGIVAGHFFDRGINHTGPFSSAGRQQAQKAFFRATFLVMGHIAKSDGRVTEHEIRIAREIMNRMNLDEQARIKAMHLFNEGKSAQFDLDTSLEDLRRECHFSKPLLQMFLQLQIQAAFADGTITTPEKAVLQHICQRLGFAKLDFDNINARFRAGATGGGYRQQSSARSSVNNTKQAYDILGINKSASDAEVKRAYRKQMSQNHPDKLMAKGLPEEMIKLATEKTQEIKAAYEHICRSRGTK